MEHMDRVRNVRLAARHGDDSLLRTRPGEAIMITRLMPALALTLALAGCGSADEGEGSSTESISMEAAAKRARDSNMKPKPGLYRVTTQRAETDVPRQEDGREGQARVSTRRYRRSP